MSDDPGSQYSDYSDDVPDAGGSGGLGLADDVPTPEDVASAFAAHEAPTPGAQAPGGSGGGSADSTILAVVEAILALLEGPTGDATNSALATFLLQFAGGFSSAANGLNPADVGAVVDPEFSKHLDEAAPDGGYVLAQYAASPPPTARVVAPDVLLQIYPSMDAVPPEITAAIREYKGVPGTVYLNELGQEVDAVEVPGVPLEDGSTGTLLKPSVPTASKWVLFGGTVTVLESAGGIGVYWLTPPGAAPFTPSDADNAPSVDALQPEPAPAAPQSPARPPPNSALIALLQGATFPDSQPFTPSTGDDSLALRLIIEDYPFSAGPVDAPPPTPEELRTALLEWANPTPPADAGTPGLRPQPWDLPPPADTGDGGSGGAPGFRRSEIALGDPGYDANADPRLAGQLGGSGTSAQGGYGGSGDGGPTLAFMSGFVEGLIKRGVPLLIARRFPVVAIGALLGGLVNAFRSDGASGVMEMVKGIIPGGSDVRAIRQGLAQVSWASMTGDSHEEGDGWAAVVAIIIQLVLLAKQAGMLGGASAAEGAPGLRTVQEAGIAPHHARRIQAVADKTGARVTVVGSRAAGTATPWSDWDYIVEGNAKARGYARWQLPKGLSGGEFDSRGAGTGIDMFREPLNPSRPHVHFDPATKR